MTRRCVQPRRGFALAMVLLLVLVSGIILAVMLERQSSQALSVQRELDSYKFHHVARGVQEAVEAWIRGNSNGDIASVLDADGRAFDLQVEGSHASGDTVHIYFYEAQGLALADFAGLSGDALDAAKAVLEQLRLEQGEKAAQFVRRDGPVAVSVNTAPEEVLHAVLASALDRQQTNALMTQILQARAENGYIDPDSISGMMDNALIDAEARAKVVGLITAQPVLWQVVAETEPPSGVSPPPPTVRYGGLAIIPAPGMARTQAGASLQRNSSFVSWDDLSDR